MGFRLGRYEVVKSLAKGVLTDLLLGRATGMEGFERYVAIKLLRSERASQPGCFEAFVNEARLAAVLHHHNIVQVHDIGADDGRPYFAMEYVHGVDLRTLLARLAKRNEQLPLQHVVSIVASIAAALHHAHEQRGSDGRPLNLVHRDVSPANVLVGFDGNVKVVDFGIAKAAINQIHADAGVLKGQAPYMSPEQCAGRPLDRRSDVFALGIVLYELATVRRLFKSANDFLTMSAVCNAEAPPPSQYRPDIPDELEKIMLKALARSPHERFYTAGDMSLALDQVASAVGVGASTSALAHYMRLQFGDVKEPWLARRPKTEEDIDEADDDFADVTEVEPPISRAPTSEPASEDTETTNERAEAHTTGSSDIALVEPLSVTAKRMPRRRRSRSLWIVLASMLVAGGGSFTAVMLAPGIEFGPAAAEAIEPATSAMRTPAETHEPAPRPVTSVPAVDAGVLEPIVVREHVPVAAPTPPPEVHMELEPTAPVRPPTKRAKKRR